MKLIYWIIQLIDRELAQTLRETRDKLRKDGIPDEVIAYGDYVYQHRN